MTKVNVKDVFIVADNVYSPVGKTAAGNFAVLEKNGSGVKKHADTAMSPLPFYASLFGQDAGFKRDGQYTKFEQLLIRSMDDALNQSAIDPGDPKTILIISTTKGNISLLETEKNSPGFKDRVALSTSAQMVADHFKFIQTPIIISNACISGVLAILTGMRLLRAGVYENAVIAGADVISKFILSGFQSFQALSPGVCRPFDEGHDGLNLGEGAGTVILSTDKKYAGGLKVKGGSVSNDANHISGPSRTGQELASAIKNTLQDAGTAAADISFISAHGTGTVYNDEMEAKALAIAGLENIPLNSLKGYYGHTLGAAGLIETIISAESLRRGLILGTPGFARAPDSYPVGASAAHKQADAINFLKTASGFGGCNAAVIIGK